MTTETNQTSPSTGCRLNGKEINHIILYRVLLTNPGGRPLTQGDDPRVSGKKEHIKHNTLILSQGHTTPEIPGTNMKSTQGIYYPGGFNLTQGRNPPNPVGRGNIPNPRHQNLARYPPQMKTPPQTKDNPIEQNPRGSLQNPKGSNTTLTQTHEYLKTHTDRMHEYLKHTRIECMNN